MISDLAVRPDDPSLCDGAQARRGAYVHIPFCARVCPYCDFAVVEGEPDLRGRYRDSVVAEVAMEPAWDVVDAVHFGGGTPTQLESAELGAILSALRQQFGLSPDAEVSLEANPEDWSPAVAESLAATGFGRVSFGAQSFDAQVLSRLGRRHTPDQIVTAVAAARDAGFTSINLDLIFGTPQETLRSWTETVERALATEPDHVSTYALTVERGTPLGREVAAGGIAPDPDLQADMYESAAALATGAGLVRYEISNYARSGHPSRYNLLTWAQGHYVAFGNGAHGHRDGVRRRNVRRLDAYLDAIADGRRPEAGSETADDWGRETERLMLGLRRAAGVVAGVGGEALMADEWGARLAEAGVIEHRGERIVVGRPLLADEVARAVLALAPVDC